MKPQFIFMIALLAGVTGAAQAAFMGSFPSEQKLVLTIQSDGACGMRTTTVQPREATEMQLRMWDQYNRLRERHGEELDTEEGNEELALEQTPGTAVGAAHSYTDGELAAKLGEMLLETQVHDEFVSPEIEVDGGSVRISIVQTFDTLADFLGEDDSMSRASTPFDRVRAEQSDNGLLQLTFFPREEFQAYTRMWRTALKSSGTRIEVRLVFPGTVVSSSWPDTATNSTWLVIDTTSDESLDALAKTLETPAVITAESGGLVLSEPLDSRDLRRSRGYHNHPFASMPIVDAEAGFIAEPHSVVVTTLHLFPEGQKQTGPANPFLGIKPGMQVRAELFPPKERLILSVSAARVVEAIDDQGRGIAAAGSDSDDDIDVADEHPGDTDEGGSMSFVLNLSLPESDSQAVDSLTGELIALTAGGWKELVLTNIQSGFTNEIDLGELVDGAKILFQKVAATSHGLEIQAQFTGPVAIRQLSIKGKGPVANMHSYMQERSARVREGQATRNVQVTVMTWGSDERSARNPIDVVIRYPAELRRERVKFVLNALDLM